MLSRLTTVKLKESDKIDIYLDLCLGIEDSVEHESDHYSNCNWCSSYSHQRIVKGTGGLGNKEKSGDHTNNCILENDQKTEKSPGDLKGLFVNRPLANADVKKSRSK